MRGTFGFSFQDETGFEWRVNFNDQVVDGFTKKDWEEVRKIKDEIIKTVNPPPPEKKKK